MRSPRRCHRPARPWLIAAVCAVAAAGCASDVPEMVPVRGKVTLAGGPWPKPGIVNFTPVKPADGFPAKPGSGHFDTDGSFTAQTGEYAGLIPGKYRISVTCWEVEPGDNNPGKSYTPEKLTMPAQSGLELEIAPGSKPVVWEKDLPRAGA